ncbi:MAG: haloacid dehalogenase-like hydrolase [Ilumatobacteraceae bacterium]
MTTTAVLWDLDGTLLRAAGTGRLSYAAALRAVTGAEFPSAVIDMGGRTDPDIAALVLAAAGFDDPALVPALLAAVDAHYQIFADEFRALTSAKPGAAQALDAFAAADIVQTVVTGNLRSIARHKVEAAGLDHHLQLEHGGYGSDHRIRTELVRMSLARLAAGGVDVDPRRTWVIGDTSRDLECAREAGVRCVLVATGTEALEILERLGADAVFADLTDLDRLHELVVG